MSLKPSLVTQGTPSDVPPVQANPARASSEGWQKSFVAISDGARLQLDLQRDTAGTLEGALQVNGAPHVVVKGRLLEDGDVYLSGANGARLHGRFKGDFTLLFGEVKLPLSEGQPARVLRDVAFKEGTPQTPLTEKGSRVVWHDRVFNASVNGNRLMMKLNRDGTKLSSSEFYLQDVGAGVVRGELEAGTYKIKTLVFTFTSVASPSVNVGEKRELVGGYFKFVNGGLDVDQNHDGQHDETREALPLELFGTWRNPVTGTTWHLERWGGSAAAWAYNARSGNANFTEEVAQEVLWAANELGVNPNDLAACLAFESAGSFSPSQENNAGGAAVGLIQFLPPSLEQMRRYLAAANGTSFSAKKVVKEVQQYGWEASKLNRAALIAMSVHEQMRYVVLHFKAHRLEPGSNLTALYQKIIAPFSDENAMYSAGSRAYADNRGLDANRDGIITAQEAASVIETNGHVRDYFLPGQGREADASRRPEPPGAAQQGRSFNVTTMTTRKRVTIQASELSMQGSYPTDTNTIAWQATRVVNQKTAAALAEVRGVAVKDLDRSSPHTGTEFLAIGADYANLRSGGVYQVHTGWDLNVDNDEGLKKPAFCAADGVVVYVGDLPGFRNTVVVYHPQLERWTRYAHLAGFAVSEGNVIKASEKIGLIGNATGTQKPHLHFDVVKRLESAGMWNGVNRDNPNTKKKDERDYNSDGVFTVEDRLEYVKDHYEDPQAFFSRVGVTIPEQK